VATLLDFPDRVTSSGALPLEALARIDKWVGELINELKTLGIAENTLVILMGDNGPATRNSPPGLAETLYRGGKDDYLEGAIRVPAMAWWPSMIAARADGRDIIRETDLFTTFAHPAGAMGHVPKDRKPDYRRIISQAPG
jgi:arylsulfatase A-like enzyme